MNLTLGIDTSNYTTSAALYNPEDGVVVQSKKLLPVKQGERGIRQSDAVFHHTQQLPDVLSRTLSAGRQQWNPDGQQWSGCISSVGVSETPRRCSGSYMPCFLVGLTNAQTAAEMLNVPLHRFSHQEGHIAAALYSANRLDLIGTDFLAFHVSGGTTEALFVHKGTECPIEAECVGGSTDLKAGQAIDRTGVMLGLSFPCGPELERLAKKSSRHFSVRPSVNGLNCSLSGVENKTQKMLREGEPPEDIALFCIRSIESSLSVMAQHLCGKYPGLPVVFSGGVMSNSIIRNDFEKEFDCCFAEPAFSSDNAAGAAVLSAYCEGLQ